jgi:hypothetical protein
MLTRIVAQRQPPIVPVIDLLYRPKPIVPACADDIGIVVRVCSRQVRPEDVQDSHPVVRVIDVLNWLQVSALTKLSEIDEAEGNEFESEMALLPGFIT